MRSVLWMLAMAACTTRIVPPDAAPSGEREGDPPLVGPYSAYDMAWFTETAGLDRPLAIGDVTGDGVGDLLVGDASFGHPSSSSFGPGRVTVFDPTVVDVDTEFAAVARFGGTHDFESIGNFGWIHDLDDDGIGDLILTGGYGTFVFYGPLPTGDHLVTEADATITDADNATVAAADVSGDGATDLVVGVSRLGKTVAFTSPILRGTTTSAAALSIPGVVVHVATGDTDGDGRADLAVSDPDAIRVFRGPVHTGDAPAQTLRDDDAGSSYDDADGKSMTVVPDVTGDGLDDVVLGAQQYGSQNNGRVVVWSGAARFQILGDTSAASLRLGRGVGGVGDLDGDGDGDLLVSTSAGTTYLIYGPLAGSQTTAALTNAWASFTGGYLVDGSGGDFTDDGVPDLWMGSPGSVYAIAGQARPRSGPLSTTELRPGDLVVSEIMANPSTVADTAGEWVELYNAAGLDVDLDGLVVRDAAGTHGQISGTVVVPPGGYVVLGTGAASGWGSTTTHPAAFYGSQPGWNNTGDQVEVQDGAGRVIDRVEYGTALAANGVSAMLELAVPDATLNDDLARWVASGQPLGAERGTPGAPNGTPPVLTVADLRAGDLVLTELLADPHAVADTAGEWIELYDSTAYAVELDGLEIEDLGGASGTVQGSLVVPAGGYVVLGRGSASTWGYNFVPSGFFGSGPSLNNGGDTILVLADGVEIDRVAYGPASVGAALQWTATPDAVANDDAESWSISTTPFEGGDLGTPGTANP